MPKHELGQVGLELPPTDAMMHSHEPLLEIHEMIAAGLVSSDRYDYDKLVARYKNWPARDADGRVPRQ